MVLSFEMNSALVQCRLISSFYDHDHSIDCFRSRITWSSPYTLNCQGLCSPVEIMNKYLVVDQPHPGIKLSAGTGFLQFGQDLVSEECEHALALDMRLD